MNSFAFRARLQSREDEELWSIQVSKESSSCHARNRSKGAKGVGCTHIISSSNSNAILLRMPAHVQNLLVEINLIGIRLLTHPLGTTSGAIGPASLLAAFFTTRAARARAAHGSRDSDLFGLESGLVGLQHNFSVVAGFCRVDHEIVVVGACHDVAGVAREGDFELVEDGIVLVRIAEAGPEVLVDGDGFDWLALHVDVPDFDRQVVAREDVAAVVGEAYVGDGGDDLTEE